VWSGKQRVSWHLFQKAIKASPTLSSLQMMLHNRHNEWSDVDPQEHHQGIIRASGQLTQVVGPVGALSISSMLGERCAALLWCTVGM
jgi:hypothetical protein